MSRLIPSISGKWFKAKENLTDKHVKSLAIPGMGIPAEKKLEDLGWNGFVVGTIALRLTTDNRNIEGGEFQLHGTISNSSFTVPAKKIWEDADEAASVTFKLPTGNMFRFSTGLTSDYLDESEVEPAVYFRNTLPDNPSLDPEEMVSLGIGNFCFRAIAFPASPGFVKVTFLVFPEGKSEILSHPLASNPCWPGIRLFDGQIPLFPLSSYKNLQWGQPFLPLFIPGSPWEAANNVPPSSEVLAKFAAIMRACAVPDTCRNGQSLATRWDELDEHGSSKLSTTRLEKVWPAPPLNSPPLHQPGLVSFPPLQCVFLFISYSYASYFFLRVSSQ